MEDSFDLFRSPVLGGNPQIIARDVDSGATFSPDGKRIIYYRFNDPEVGKFQLLMANSDGTDEKIIAGGTMANGHLNVSWSPDGKRLALTDTSQGPAPMQIMEIESGKTQFLADMKGYSFFNTVWMPDGGGLLAMYQDLTAGHTQIGFVSYPSGNFHPVTKDTNTYFSLTLSSDAKTLATVQAKTFVTLYTFPAAGMGASLPTPVLPQQQRRNFDFGWDGNGSFYLLSDNHLARMTSDGSNSTPILSNDSITSISACPDGRTLLLAMIGKGAEAAPTSGG